jgi:uncharacterized membrane protein YfcA
VRPKAVGVKLAVCGLECSIRARRGAGLGLFRGKHTMMRRRPSAYEVATGAITDFLDTLGIGSFATTASLLKLRNAIPDRLLPGTLNVGHTLPTVAQALIYISVVRVERLTLILMIATATLGAWIGAGLVSRWSAHAVRVGMGLALLAAVLLMVAQQARLFPSGGGATGLHGTRLALGALGNFWLGALMTLGIGLYAPCMILVSLLGMNPIAAFPIMMGSCAALMPVASSRFMARRAYAPATALGLTLGGLPAVLVAAWWVRSLSLEAVRWLVIVVVTYTSVSMLRSAHR